MGLTSLTQGVVATLVYLALGLPRWWVLGPITGLTSIVPLAGTAVVWLPLAVGLFLTDHVVKASLLTVLGLGVIGSIDNVLRPVFARIGSLQLPTFVLYVGIFGAIAAIGPWGVLLGPLVLRLWKEAMVLQRETESPSPDV